MTRDTKKRCLKCGGDLVAIVTITKAVPLADRNGTVKIGGVKVGQMDLKNFWDKNNAREDAPDQAIRGPIKCVDCETEHFYLVGDKKPLRVGSTAEARAEGADALRTP